MRSGRLLVGLPRTPLCSQRVHLILFRSILFLPVLCVLLPLASVNLLQSLLIWLPLCPQNSVHGFSRDSEAFSQHRSSKGVGLGFMEGADDVHGLAGELLRGFPSAKLLSKGMGAHGICWRFLTRGMPGLLAVYLDLKASTK